MKTGNEILRRAMILLNYVDAYGAVDTAKGAELWRRGLAALNQIYAELWYQERGEAVFVPLAQPNEEVLLSERVRQTVMPYGVAMLLAQSEGDGDEQQLFASLYNAKRTAVAGGLFLRQDALPRGNDF